VIICAYRNIFPKLDTKHPVPTPIAGIELYLGVHLTVVNKRS